MQRAYGVLRIIAGQHHNAAAAAASVTAGTPSMPGAVRYNPAAPAPANLR